jgi:hypothetical protein
LKKKKCGKNRPKLLERLDRTGRKYAKLSTRKTLQKKSAEKSEIFFPRRLFVWLQVLAKPGSGHRSAKTSIDVDGRN